MGFIQDDLAGKGSQRSFSERTPFNFCFRMFFSDFGRAAERLESMQQGVTSQCSTKCLGKVGFVAVNATKYTLTSTCDQVQHPTPTHPLPHFVARETESERASSNSNLVCHGVCVRMSYLKPLSMTVKKSIASVKPIEGSSSILEALCGYTHAAIEATVSLSPFTHTLDVHTRTNTGNKCMHLFCFITFVFPTRTLLLPLSITGSEGCSKGPHEAFGPDDLLKRAEVKKERRRARRGESGTASDIARNASSSSSLHPQRTVTASYNSSACKLCPQSTESEDLLHSSSMSTIRNAQISDNEAGYHTQISENEATGCTRICI